MLRDVNFAFPFRLKGTDKIHTKGLFKFHSNPTSYWTDNGSKLRFSGLIREFHYNESF